MSIFRRIGDTLGDAVNGAKGGMAAGLGAVAREFGGQAPAPVPGVGYTPRPVGGFMAPPRAIGGGTIASVFNARFGQQTGGFTAPGFSSPGMGYRPPTLTRPVKPEAKVPSVPGGPTSDGTGDAGTAKWRTFIEQAAGEYGIADPDIIQAIMMIESGGNERAQSTQGAQGLMQVMPFHWQPGEDPWDPRTNVRKGASILAANYKQYQDWDKAVAAYLGAIDGNGNITTSTDANGTDGFKYVAMFRANLAKLKAAGTRQAGGRAPVNAEGSAFPVQGYAGQVQLHWGEDPGAADLFAAAGTPVAAMRGGRVTSAGYSDIGGWNVTIQGEDGLTYYYAHLQNQPSVQAGQTIASGAIFGQVGDTGNAKGTGAHLHLGIGYGIQSGTGPRGGSGISFNATEYLQRVLGMTARR